MCPRKHNPVKKVRKLTNLTLILNLSRNNCKRYTTLGHHNAISIGKEKSKCYKRNNGLDKETKIKISG